MYGFEGEVKTKYCEKMAKLFTEIFNCLPLCYVINGKVFVSQFLYTGQKYVSKWVRNLGLPWRRAQGGGCNA